MKLWLRHPMRMLNFVAYGCCPACNSSPPDPKCYVCHGSYQYGPKITPEDKVVWRARFVAGSDSEP
jgi:hypothetical protein